MTDIINNRHFSDRDSDKEFFHDAESHYAREDILDIEKNPFKNDFPLLKADKSLHYLDSAATSQRPACVIDAQEHFYKKTNANPLRGLYQLSIEATQDVEAARKKVAEFISAPSEKDIIFTRNTTESLNLVAHTLGDLILHKGDEVVITIMEHHSNLIPWQQITRRKGAKLVYLYPDKEGHISDEEIEKKITPKTKIVSVAHVSNVLGITLPVEKIAKRAHDVGASSPELRLSTVGTPAPNMGNTCALDAEGKPLNIKGPLETSAVQTPLPGIKGAVVIVDAAQSIPHKHVNVKKLDCDLLAFSVHKLFGPFGVGILWGKQALLLAMPPFLTGGEMIDAVTEDSAIWAPLPEKFEAGTQDAAGIAASKYALDYVWAVGISNIEEREKSLVSYLCEQLAELPYVKIYGPENPAERTGVVAFNLDGIHPHDVASLLDTKGVAIRAGHHCAQPLMQFLGTDSTNRASVAFYNDKADIDALIDGLKYVWSIFHPEDVAKTE